MLINLSFKIFLRELRSGYLTSILVSLVLAITIVSGISLFTDRLEKALSAETEEFLGGNLKFESNENTAKSKIQRQEFKDIDFMEMVLFASVIFSDEDMQLSSVKAVDSAYPLLGELELQNESGKFLYKESPELGTVWMDARLQNLLNLSYGDKIFLGDSEFIFAATILYEPDRASGNFAFAPKTIMNFEDVESTNIIQPGSRVEYNYLFKGPEDEIANVRNYLETIKENGDDIVILSEDSSSLGRTIDRSENFFLLGGLIAVLLSACTIGIASQRFTRRHVNYVAMLKTLGMETTQIRMMYFLLFLLITFLTLVFGLILGWTLQSQFINLMSSYFPTKLPPPGYYPILITCLTVVICQFGFIYPHITKLITISPMRILKDDISFDYGFIPVFLMGLAAFFLLLYLYTNQFTLSLIIFFGVIGFSAIGIGSIYLLLGKNKNGLGASGPVLLALSELRRRKFGNSFQIFAFTIAIGLTLITFSASQNLLGSWQTSIPEDSPNNFAINITQQDKENMQSFLQENEIKSKPFYPVTNATISKKEEQNIEDKIDRNFNITWIEELPEQNDILKGEWFNKNLINGISISDDISARYELEIGDEVYIKVGEEIIESYVQSTRIVNWDNFSPNFFIIGHPSLFKDISSTYITSFYIPSDKQYLAADLMREFRTVSVFSIEELIEQIKEIIEQVTQALNSILLLTSLSALFLAFSTLQDGFSVRKHQSAVLRTLGASNTLIKQSTLFEFTLLGLISGTLGALIAHAGIYFIETRVFETTPSFYPEISIMGPLLGIIVVSSLCYYLISGISKQSPKKLLMQ